jgi:hypothetical protein
MMTNAQLYLALGVFVAVQGAIVYHMDRRFGDLRDELREVRADIREMRADIKLIVGKLADLDTPVSVIEERLPR